MAILSISQAIAAIEGYGQKVAWRAEEIMKEEIRNSTHGTGYMASQVRADQIDTSTWEVRSHAASEKGFLYPTVVQKGRGPVYGNPVLAWQSSSSPWGINRNGWVFARKVGPTKPNDYIGRTKARIENEHISLT